MSEAALLKEQKVMSFQIGWTILFVSIGMLFMTLFLAYGIFRYQQSMWPPMGMEKQPLIYSSLSTFIILVSSFTMERTKAFSVLDIAKFRMYLMMTFLLGVLFCLSQWTVWSDLNSRGLAIHQGIFPSILHGFTYVHIAHIVIAFIGILWPLKIKSIRVWKEESNQVLLENITKCWHFLGIIWLIMYLALFVF